MAFAKSRGRITKEILVKLVEGSLAWISPPLFRRFPATTRTFFPLSTSHRLYNFDLCFSLHLESVALKISKWFKAIFEFVLVFMWLNILLILVWKMGDEHVQEVDFQFARMFHRKYKLPLWYCLLSQTWIFLLNSYFRIIKMHF